MAQYMIAFNDEWVAEHSADELIAKSDSAGVVLEAMKTAGVFVFSDGGLAADTVVCSVEVTDGAPVFTDGPFVETKEHLGGLCVIDVSDETAAREWAGRLAVALDWPQEVHRFPNRAQLLERAAR